MRITYIHHSSFLVETDICYYLFDYEKGCLPKMEKTKPIFVLSSHGHHDHYNPEIFSMLEEALGMQCIYAVLSDDIEIPADGNILQADICKQQEDTLRTCAELLRENTKKQQNNDDCSKDKKCGLQIEFLQVSPGMEYSLCLGQTLTTFKSTDLGAAFLIEDHGESIYHAGDLNDWVWEGEGDSYNEQMTMDYREQIDLLSDHLQQQEIDAAFVVLDPRQEKDYDRGLCYFLEKISVKEVYPMHYWGQPDIIGTFLKEHSQYEHKIKKTE